MADVNAKTISGIETGAFMRDVRTRRNLKTQATMDKVGEIVWIGIY